MRLPLPAPVPQALARFGADLGKLRKRRRLSMAQAADRALISRSTLYKVERGDPGVALGIYASVLQGYGLLDRMVAVVDPCRDRAGLALEDARLPRRVRMAQPVAPDLPNPG